MSDSSYVAVSKSYWNWEIVGSVNSIYRDLINIDPEAVPYLNKLSLTSFFLKSRKWYVGNINPFVVFSEAWLMNKVSDIVNIDNSWCWNGNCYYMYYQMTDDKSRYRVIRKDCEWCNSMTIVQEWYRCPCDTEKMFTLDFPIWNIIQEWIWTQSVMEDWLTHIFSDDNIVTTVDWWNIHAWDYVLFYSTSNSINPWQCGIYRQITTVNKWYVVLDTWYDWITADNASSRKWEDIKYKVFRNVGKTVGWVWNNWLNIYHWSDDVTEICWSRWGCLLSVINHNWIINVLTDKWYNSFWWIGENIMYFVWTDTKFVWTDKISSISFGDFLVIAWKHNIVATVFSDKWEYSYTYDITSASFENLWIYSKYSMATFQNWLYIMCSDKRLYAAEIAGSNSKYYLKLTSQSETIFNELDLLQEWDDVSLSSYQNKLYVFINGRCDTEDSYTNKTKIKIYNSDYKLWYTHIIPRWVINCCKYWIFLWNWLFQYVWDRDIYTLWTNQEEFIHKSPIRTEIIFDIVNSENHWITNSLGNRVSLMSYKKLNWMKTLLWPWKYTDETYINIDSYVGWYKFTKKIEWFDSNWIDNINKYYEWDYENIEVSECFSEMLSKCDNMSHTCDGSKANTDVRESLRSPICHRDWYEQDINYEPHRFDDYAICYDEKWYMLSPINHIYINPQMKYPAILNTIHIVSDNYDRINFGWAIVEYEAYPITYKEKAWYDIDPTICEKEKWCPNQNCS